MPPANPTVLNLIDASELSQKMNNRISAERLIELATTRFLPHYDFDGRILFAFHEARTWLNANVLSYVPGRPIPHTLVVSPMIYRPDPPPIPPELRPVADYLMFIPIQSLLHALFSGIYFLCRNSQVVYVGQSEKIASRVVGHCTDKEFDFAYCLRLPKGDLDYLESSFIGAIRPEYNKSGGVQRLTGMPISEFGQRVVRIMKPDITDAAVAGLVG